MGGGDYNNNILNNINELEKALGYDNVHRRRRCLGSSEDDGDGNSPDQQDHRTVEDEDEDEDDDDDDDDESGSNVSQVITGERTIYWDSQEAMLQEILEHYSSTGTKLRKEISRLIETAKNEEETATNSSCKCRNPKKSDGCAKCFRQRVVNLLCQKGFHASLCTSTWSSTNNFPGGTHEYIEVIVSTQSRKKKITFLIEVGFQDEFKMAKGSQEYHALTNQLPEIFIGKSDHLNAIVRVICDAAKRSTTEMKMHLGPWRKRRFMQRKWSASQEKLSLSINNYASKILGPVASAGEEHVGFKCGFQFSAAAAAVKVA